MQSKTRKIGTGGLAEINPNPSDVTMAYFEKWFRGSASMGRALQLLKLPYEVNDKPWVVKQDGNLVVDLTAVEQTMYQFSLLGYGQQTRDQGDLKFQWSKAFSWSSWRGTWQLVKVQSLWIARPEQVTKSVTNWVRHLPRVEYGQDGWDEEKISAILEKRIWPVVLAIGMVNEFWTELMKRELGDEFGDFELAVSTYATKDDWYFRSIKDQALVRGSKMTMREYIQEYGVRADQDYELMCPRWWEVVQDLEARIMQMRDPMFKGGQSEVHNDRNNDRQRWLAVLVEIHVLRSKARRIALEWFDFLRQELLKSGKLDVLAEGTRSLSSVSRGVLSGKTEGVGVGISPGKAEGQVALFTNGRLPQLYEHTIGVFANASPEWSMYYAQCEGIILLKGGITSHGAIVARELQIPGLVDEQAQGLNSGDYMTLDGKSGAWQVVKSNLTKQIGQDEKKDWEDRIIPISYKSLHQHEQHEGPWVVDLRSVGRSDSDWVGNKAANLGELLGMGINVPGGFVVSVLGSQLLITSEQKRQLEQKIREIWKSTGFDLVSVRSSGVAEDSENRSWAGQLDSFLGVDEVHLLEKIRGVIQSADSLRAKWYGDRLENNEHAGDVGVIVQRLADCQVSGVLLSQNPLDVGGNQLLIEAVWGLGQSLVDGQIHPMRFVVDKDDMRLVSAVEGNQIRMWKVIKGQVREVLVHQEFRETFGLSQRQLLELAMLGIKLEKYFGFPVDVEWGIEHGKLVVLQVRKLTA